MLSSNMLLLNLILLIDVTFSTPTGHSAQNAPGKSFERYAYLQQLPSEHIKKGCLWDRQCVRSGEQSWTAF